ncbi:MAG: drug/metabolite transporter (DMT)-like permease [Polaribacter sp.]|jgi:drug/metabolite transporter (DMT)-like permease|tara:strand:+ start:198 stop:1085 length:888 start_codon:yes stop_codon:yes gene_type:complete
MIKKILPVISIILGCVLWGLAIVLTKKTINELIFPHLAMYRFIIASIVFIPFVKKKTLPSINKSDIKYFIYTGFLTVPCTFLLQFAGISFTSSTNASLIVGMTPTVFIIMSYILFRKKENKTTILAVILSVIGILIVVGSPSSENNWLGNFLIIISLITLSLSAITSQNLMKTYSPLTTTILTFWLGTFLLIPSVIYFYGLPSINLNNNLITSICFQGIFCTSLAYFLWNYGLQKIPIAKAGIYANIEPIAGILFTTLLLSEKITLQIAIGGILVIISAVAISIIDFYNFKKMKK